MLDHNKSKEHKKDRSVKSGLESAAIYPPGPSPAKYFRRICA